jgi:hypothetical protein
VTIAVGIRGQDSGEGRLVALARMSATTTASSPRAGAVGSLLRPIDGRLVLVAVIVAELAIWYGLVSTGGWAYDDNLSIELAKQSGLTWHWLTSDLFGHVEIAHRLAFSILNHLMPIDYRWALLAMLLALGASMWVLARIVQELTGGVGPAVLAAGYLGLSVLFTRSMEWWSSGLETFPTVLCDLICLWAYLRFLTTPSSRWIAVSAGALAIGLLFYEKPALMVLYLLLIRVLLLSGTPSRRAFISAASGEARIWAALAAVIAGYAILRVALGTSDVASQGASSLGAWLQMYGLMWTKSLVPSMFGMMLPTPHVSTWQLSGGIALQLFVITAVAVSIRRKASAWRAWACLAVCVVANGAIVGVARLGLLGPGAATDGRYLIDFSWLMPLLVCYAFSGCSSFRPRADVAPVKLSIARARTPALAAAAACVYVAAAIASITSMQKGWAGRDTRVWEANVESGLAALDRAAARPVIADAATPGAIVGGDTFAPYNYLSYLLPHYNPGAQVDGPLDGPLVMIGVWGTPRPAYVSEVFGAIGRPSGQCSPAAVRPVRVERAIPARAGATGRAYYLLAEYTTRSKLGLNVFVDHGKGYPPEPDHKLWISPRPASSISWLGDGPPHGIAVDLPFGAGVCLRKLSVVTLAARAAGAGAAGAEAG